jgi:hypothetical protein
VNERIKELKHQASLWCDKNIPEQYSEETNSYGTAWEDKFAELLIRECAKSVDKVYEDAEPDHGCYDWATFARGIDVLKHFGV